MFRGTPKKVSEPNFNSHGNCQGFSEKTSVLLQPNLTLYPVGILSVTTLTFYPVEILSDSNLP